MPKLRNLGGPADRQRLKIVHLADHHTQGGAARAAYRIHKSLLHSPGINSTFLSFRIDATAVGEPLLQAASRPKVFRSERLNRFSAYFRDFLSPSVRLLYDLVFTRNLPLEEQLSELRPDIVVVHWVRPKDVPARSLRAMNVPVVSVLHDARFVLGSLHYPESNSEDSGPTRLNRRERIVARIVRASIPEEHTTLVGPSSWIANVANLAGWPEQAIRTIPLPLDTEFWRPKPNISENGNSERKVFRVGFGFQGEHAGRRKGADIFADALGLLMEAPPPTGIDLQVCFFGDAESPTKETEFDSTIELGHLTDAQLRDLFFQLDLVVLPSRTESFGQIAIEAQACGTAVVVASNTGLETALVPGAGWRFINGNSRDLARIISAAWSEPDEAARRGEIASKVAPRLFSEQAIMTQYVSLFDALDARQSPRPQT